MAHILLVEDDEISSLVLSTILSEEQFSVAKASDYTSALEAATERAPDLLISDWRLDGHRTGADVARDLHKRNERLKVIFISGIERDRIEAETVGLNVAAILAKPCDFDEVVALAKNAVSS